MKIQKYMIVLAVLALFFTACKDWLDVKPKTEIDAERLYERESGFKQVLTGAYTSLCGASMHGREMTFGMVDALGGVYPVTGGGVYSHVRAYDYEEAEVEALISATWSASYNTITNLNHMISYLRKADRGMFAEDNYNVILGEALGLRAFIHFDLLKLFAPSYKANKDAVSIPYVTQYKFNVTPQYTVSAVMDSILVDLTEAAGLLELSDPLVTGREITVRDDDGYLQNREFRFNYYAVRTVMARLHMWKGETAKAAQYAQEVIRSNRFRWVSFDEVATPDAASRDRTFSPEHVFVLQDMNIVNNYAGVLKRPAFNYMSGSNLLFSPAYLAGLFTTSDDWRRMYLWAEEGSAGTDLSSTKLWQYEEMPAEFKYRQPLIRLPELYLILAETMLDTDPDGAAELISTMMANRGIAGGVPPGSTTEEVRNAMVMEYRREFLCEGIMFYYFKRLDSATIDGAAAGAFTKDKYVLPMPTAELEFGNRE